MAKCEDCDYPYATANNCPNCGSDNPRGGSTIGGIIVFVIICIVLVKSCG